MINIRFLFVVVIYVSFCNLFAVGQDSTKIDSLVFFKDFTYSSEFERNAFKDFFLKDNKNYIEMFLAIDSADENSLRNVRSSIQHEIEKYKTASFAKMKEAKKVKKILKDVHESYFEKYELKAYFDEVFLSGIFNCVTASALYAIIFNDIEIPYTIKLSWNHVYIIAYPSTNSIMVETTNPMAGYDIYDQHFKEKYVEYLTTIKIIRESEANSKSVDDLFNEYFYKEKDINLTNLIGIQYHNKGLEFLEKKDYEDAFYSIEKAYYLYPSDEIGYLLLVSNALVLNGCDYNVFRYADNLAKFCRYGKLGISNKDISNEFGRVTYEVLINSSNTELYTDYYKKLSEEIRDSSLKDDIGFVYFSEMGRFLFNKSKYAESLHYSEKAFGIEPKNADAENLFVTNLILNYADAGNREKVLDTLNYYVAKYPELENIDKFNTLRYHIILDICNKSFYMYNSKKAFKYLEMFENSLPDDYSDFDFSMVLKEIEKAYSTAGSYYFKKGQLSESKKYLKKGLEFVPNSFELNRKLSSLENGW